MLCLSAVSAQDLSDQNSEYAADENYQLEIEDDSNNFTQAYQENGADEAVLESGSNPDQILNQSDSASEVLGDDGPIFNVEIEDNPGPSFSIIIVDLGETHNVEGDTFADIRNAIQHSANGDKIVLTGGKTYLGDGNPIIVNRHLTITSNGGNAILDGQNLSQILQVGRGCQVTVENMDFINGMSSESGGAVLWAGPNGKLRNCNFISNHAAVHGGAILWGHNDGTIENCNFINNSAGGCGGVMIWGYRNKIRNCNFTGNCANRQGGAAYLCSDGNEFINCNFMNNSALYGGAVRSQANNDNYVGCYFVQNSASLAGAILWLPMDTDNESVSWGNYSVSGCNFINNSATSGYGGAIYCAYGCSSIANSNFYGNSANGQQGYGGAVICAGDDSTIMNSNFYGNSANGDNGYGGAVCIKAKNVVVGECTFRNNSAMRGGAVIMVYVPDVNGLITDSLFIDNSAVVTGDDLYINSEYQSYALSCSFKHKANSTALDVNDENLRLTFDFKASIDYDDSVVGDFIGSYQYFWNGESFVMRNIYDDNVLGDVRPVNQTMILEIYNSTDGLVANVTGFTDSFGQTAYDYRSLPDGQYTYRAYHPESDDFSFILKEGSFERFHIPTEVSVSIDSVTYPGPATAAVTASSPGTYRLVIAGEEYGNVTFTEDEISNGGGKATKTVSVDMLGANDNYEASVIYETSDMYASASNQTRFSVYRTATAIDVNESIGYCGEGAEIVYAVENDTAADVAGIRNGSAVLVEGSDYAVISNENGKIIVTGLATGTYVVNLTAGMDDNHYPTSKEFTLIIKPSADLSIAVASSSQSPLYGDTVAYAVTVTNNGPNAASDVIIAYAIPNGVNVSSNDASYVGNGVWNISSIAQGSENAVNLTLYATVKSLGSVLNSFTVASNVHDKNAENNGACASLNVKIHTALTCKAMTTTAIDVSADGKKGQYYSLVLRDANNKLLAGKTVQITLDKVTYKVKTDSKGVAKVQVNIKKAGTYTASVKFAGDSKYLKTSASAKIKVNKQKPSIVSSKKTFSLGAKTKKITAVLKTSKGKIIKGKSVTFTINGKKYTAKTNSKGIATINAKLTKKGTYSCSIKYAGDVTYSPVAKKIAVVVK